MSFVRTTPSLSEMPPPIECAIFCAGTQTGTSFTLYRFLNTHTAHTIHSFSPLAHPHRTTAVAIITTPSLPPYIISAAADKSIRLWRCIDQKRKKFVCQRHLNKRPAEVRAIAVVPPPPSLPPPQTGKKNNQISKKNRWEPWCWEMSLENYLHGIL